MKSFVCFLFTLLVIFQSDANPLVHYDIFYEEENDQSLTVILTYLSPDSSHSQITIPDKWGGAFDLFEDIKIKELSGASIVDSTDLREVWIEHNSNSPIRLKYEVSLSHIEDDVKYHGDLYKPFIRNEILQFIGTAVFIYPRQKVRSIIKMKWHIPDSWEVHNSFGTGQREQLFYGVTDIWSDAVFWMGDFDRHLIDVQSKPVYMVFNDEDWKFTQAEFSDMLLQVISFQRAFWGDHDFPYYTVTLTEYPATHGGMAYTGTGLEQSFALYATRNAELKDLMYLLMHELLHEWIGRQIRNGNPEHEYYWFSEGFTDYFTYLLAFESGLANREDCLGRMNQKITDYYTSPVCQVSNDEIGEHFFTKHQTYGKLPYDRGSAFAMYLDYLIRNQSQNEQSLKDAILDLLNDCRSLSTQMSKEMFISAVQPYLDCSADSLMQHHMYEGHLVPIKEFPTVSKSMREKRLPIFDTGFDYEKSRSSKQIENVDVNSNAYKAGLRDGQLLKGVSMYMGQTDHDVELIVESEEGEMEIRYRPVKLSQQKIPVLE